MIDKSRHRGRHRAPNRTASTAFRVSAAVAVSGGLVAAAAAPAGAATGVGSLAPESNTSHGTSIPQPLAPPFAGGVSAVPTQSGTTDAAATERVHLPTLVHARDLVKPIARSAPVVKRSKPPVSGKVTPRKPKAGPGQPTQTLPTPEPRKRTPGPEQPKPGPEPRKRTPGPEQPKPSPAPEKPRPEPTPKSSSQSQREKVIAIGKSLLGTPYKLGSEGTDTFDCSGFTGYVFRKAGIELPRDSRQQRAAVPRTSNPQPGDLVFVGSPVRHVAIYLDENTVLDATSWGKGEVQIHRNWLDVSFTYGNPY